MIKGTTGLPAISSSGQPACQARPSRLNESDPPAPRCEALRAAGGQVERCGQGEAGGHQALPDLS